MPLQVYTSLRDAKPCGRGAVALGYFDGLHIGHLAVIGRAVEAARAGLCPCVFTFTMGGAHHPQGKTPESELTTVDQKLRLLERRGVRLVLEPAFEEFSGMSPERFVDEVLVERMGAAVACCGEDFRFGKRAAAGADELAALCRARGIELKVVPSVLYGGERVSSTRIRGLLAAGGVEEAAAMLGRAFSYDFPVERGRQLGRRLDFPTINQHMPERFVTLRRGVYASVSVVGDRLYPSVTNIGVKPTVDDGLPVTSETCILGFSGDLYGRRVEVRLLRFLRAERKFDSVRALREQIAADRAASEPIAGDYLAAIEK